MQYYCQFQLFLECYFIFQTQNDGFKIQHRFYPIPQKALDPNAKSSRVISTETSNALKKIKKEQWTSTYSRCMTTGENFQLKYVHSIDDQEVDLSKVSLLLTLNIYCLSYFFRWAP